MEGEAFELEKARAENVLLAQELERERADRQRERQEADRAALSEEIRSTAGRLSGSTAGESPEVGPPAAGFSQVPPGTQAMMDRYQALAPHMSLEGQQWLLNNLHQKQAQRIFEAGKTRMAAQIGGIMRAPVVGGNEEASAKLSEVLAGVIEAQTPEELQQAEKGVQDYLEVLSRQDAEAAIQADGESEVTALLNGLPPGDPRKPALRKHLSDWRTRKGGISYGPADYQRFVSGAEAIVKGRWDATANNYLGGLVPREVDRPEMIPAEFRGGAPEAGELAQAGSLSGAASAGQELRKAPGKGAKPEELKPFYDFLYQLGVKIRAGMDRDDIAAFAAQAGYDIESLSDAHFKAIQKIVTGTPKRWMIPKGPVEFADVDPDAIPTEPVPRSRWF